MRILATGQTEKECKDDITNKISRGWKAVAPMKFDSSWIGGRYVCVMEKEDIPNSKKRKFNQYLGCF
jgi:hypothetical protein